jgi:hypothetical protein
MNTVAVLLELAAECAKHWLTLFLQVAASLWMLVGAKPKGAGGSTMLPLPWRLPLGLRRAACRGRPADVATGQAGFKR